MSDTYQWLELRDLQAKVRVWYEMNGFDAPPATLMMGVMEEVGELSQALLLTGHGDGFKPRPEKLGDVWASARCPDHEIGDIITYLLALCNALGIEPHFWWLENVK